MMILLTVVGMCLFCLCLATIPFSYFSYFTFYTPHYTPHVFLYYTPHILLPTSQTTAMRTAREKKEVLEAVAESTRQLTSTA